MGVTAMTLGRWLGVSELMVVSAIDQHADLKNTTLLYVHKLETRFYPYIISKCFGPHNNEKQLLKHYHY